MFRRISWFVSCAILCSLLVLAAFAQSEKPKPVLDVTSLDRTVNPCTDFYTFSCGGWMKANPIPADQSNWSAYSKVSDETRDRLRAILEDIAQPNPNRTPHQQKAGDYYAACMDEKAAEEKGAAPIKPDLDRIAKLRSKAEITALVADLHQRVGSGMLFNFGSTQDAKNSTETIADADQGGLGMPDRDFYLKTDKKSLETREAYVKHVTRTFALLGDKPPVAKKNAATVLRIETALANGSQTRVERRDPDNTYHKMTVAQLTALAPAIRWDVYFKTLGVDTARSLNVDAPNFFKTLSLQLQKEPLANWKTYLRWHLAHEESNELSSAFVNESFEFYGKVLRGAQQLQPRWKRCVRSVDNNLGEALGQAYAEKYFAPEQKARVVTMVHGIENAMQQDITTLDWMSDATKKRALEKLQSVANKIGYPDKWRDYSAVEVTRGDFAGNSQRASQFEFQRQLRKIGQPLDRGEWGMTPPTVNAYYNPQMNDINFPAGILQPPLFDPAEDDAPNYGNTGGTIGHELTHGFDDQGRRFDAEGNLKEWWTPEDGKEFEKRAACISTQYSGYTIVDDIKINGKLTLGEDVADLGGLILAYVAWQDASKDKHLDSAEGFTPEQRFFVGYAQSWCTNEREEEKRTRATTDPHSPEQYRANGVLVNMPQFQQAFHCASGTAMAPKERCRVW